MQNTFCEPGSPAEVPVSREIVPAINDLTRHLRALEIPIIWILHANTQARGYSDWGLFFDHVVSDNVRQRTLESLTPGYQAIWKELETDPSDISIIKNRYSALIAGS